MTMFMVLLSRLSHFESSPGSSDVRRPVPDGRRPSDQANRPGLQVYIHHRHFIITQLETDTHFTVTRRVEGWVNLGTQHAALYNVII